MASIAGSVLAALLVVSAAQRDDPPTAACSVVSNGPYNVVVTWSDVKGVRGVLVTDGTSRTSATLDRPLRTGNHGFAGLGYSPTTAQLLGRASTVLLTVSCSSTVGS